VKCSQVTHWHSPKFHAYFPTAQSYPAILADMLSGAIACIGFTWVSTKVDETLFSPRTIVAFWICYMINSSKSCNAIDAKIPV